MKGSWVGAIAVVAGAAIAACGSEVTSGPGGAGGGGAGGGSGVGAGLSSWEAYCEARASACGIDAGACKAEESCALALLRDAAEGPLLGCLASNCDEDACVAQTLALLPPSAAGQAFAASCQDHLDACPSGNDDLCSSVVLLADDVIATFQACTGSASCAAVEACFDQVSAATFDACDDWL
jgi:hypothetical protein